MPQNEIKALVSFCGTPNGIYGISLAYWLKQFYPTEQ